MNLKKIHPSTIIPKELYVERSADRQLRSVINDMGRPGYVLVARQMGKTNLLINMKRENEADVVIYLDLSNRFNSVRSWFRHVIDSLIEAYPDLFNGALETITVQRMTYDLEPNVEYDRHLRLLLRSINRRCIIVLDEIDSLVNAHYSDVILAQIRSMYFSRVNYKEYGRLTYILSGVIEPSDLIKDKNISPFNIGEKIYLEDFSIDEFKIFLKKATLDIKSDVTFAIYDWTQGNPRMTWDICNELEDRILNGENASKEIIDEIVEKLYLRNYDLAPIDHIRTLVESDHQIRDAIVSIRYSKSEFLDDKMKSRLYLSGIVKTSSFGEILIKNKIIDMALSDRWLTQISIKYSSQIKKANQYFIEEEYESALSVYLQVFSDPSLIDELTCGDRYEFGLSYFYTGNKLKSIKEFRKCLDETADPSFIQSIYYYMGLAQFSEELYQDSLDSFQFAANGPLEKIQIMAKLNILSAYLGLGSSHIKTAINFGSDLIKELDIKENIENNNKLEYIVSAYCSTAKANILIEDFNLSRKLLERAFFIAPIELKIAILLYQYELPQSIEKKTELLIKTYNIILENQLTKLPDDNLFNLNLNKVRLATTLTLLKSHELIAEFDALSRYISNDIFDKISVAETLLILYESINTESKRSFYIPLLEIALDHYFEEVDTSIKLKILRTVSVYSSAPQINNWRLRYLHELEHSVIENSIEEDDLIALLVVASAMKNRNSFSELGRLFNLWKSIESKSLISDNRFTVLFYYHEMIYLTSSGQKSKAIIKARHLVDLTDKIEIADDDVSLDKLIPDIRKQALSIIPKTPRLLGKLDKFQRNQKVSVRYENCEVQVKKFKLVEKDLLEGKCTLVE